MKIYKTNLQILKRVKAVKKKGNNGKKKCNISKCNIRKGSDDIKNYEMGKLSKPA